jgi:hypothetical protein
MRIKFAAAVLLAALAAGCKRPTYTRYRSVFNDFASSLPTGWNVYTESSGLDFAETRFIGPFDGDALFGLPSFSVKWFRNGRGHVLRDGSVESYANADDYIAKTLAQVYDYHYDDTRKIRILTSIVPNSSGEYDDIIPKPSDIPLLPHKESGLPLKMFIIRSPVRVSSNVRWGVDLGPDGKPYNNRMHAYATISLPSGFYVLSYPATVRSFPHNFARFCELVWRFHPYTDGPGGPRVVLQRLN